jgi:hypothetical protein
MHFGDRPLGLDLPVELLEILLVLLLLGGQRLQEFLDVALGGLGGRVEVELLRVVLGDLGVADDFAVISSIPTPLLPSGLYDAYRNPCGWSYRGLLVQKRRS